MASDILMIIKTRKLETDDRLRKECNTLSKLGKKVEVYAWLDSNNSDSGKCYLDAEFKQVKLITRFLSSRIFLLLHLIEFLIKSLFFTIIKRPKVIWLHDPIMFPCVCFFALLRVFGVIDKVYWDQHETPPKVVRKSRLFRFIFGKICNFADIVIVANRERGEYLKDEFKVTASIQYLNNFSDKSFINAPRTKLPKDIRTFLNGRDYLLAQNGADFKRNFESLVRAVLIAKKYPVLLVGYVDEVIEDRLIKEFGSLYHNYFYKVGVVPQLALTSYLDNALASVILYKNTDANQWYCEPNRLYQALNFRKKVIVGANPTMSNIVTLENAGIVLSDDGSACQELANAIILIAEGKYYSDADTTISERYTWEFQESKIHELFG